VERSVGQAAHLVTAIRIVAAPCFAVSLLEERFALATALIVLAALTDFADGRVARRLGTASEAGRWLDHFADIGFLLSGFGALAALGRVPLYVPMAIAAAFAFYVVDSVRRSARGSLIGSRLGHLSGVLNYGILVGLVVDASFGDAVLPKDLRAVALGAVPLYSAAAILGRLLEPPRETGR
jgi:phosphatidylglycerophosphate synthase